MKITVKKASLFDWFDLKAKLVCRVQNLCNNQFKRKLVTKLQPRNFYKFLVATELSQTSIGCNVVPRREVDILMFHSTIENFARTGPSFIRIINRFYLSRFSQSKAEMIRK